VPVVPLDTVLLEANDVNNGGDVAVLLKYSLLKIDAEGSEIGMLFFLFVCLLLSVMVCVRLVL